MKHIDWDIVKIQYEIFGESATELARQYDTTPRMIEYAAEQREWTPVHIPTIDTSDPDQLSEEIEARLSIMSTLKNAALNPKYIALETAILSKALEIIQTITAENPLSAQALKQLADMLSAMRNQNGSGKDNEKSTGVTVRIMNKVQDSGGSAREDAVEVQVQQEF